MSLKQPVTQVRLTNVAVVRLRVGGERFEVACYKNKVLNWREGKETDLNEVLQVHAVFHNVSKGELAKKAELQRHFGTSDQHACILRILDKGELQVSELERRQHLEHLFSDIVSCVVDLTYSAVTGLPLSRSAVSTALKSIGFAVRMQLSAKAQALHAALLLQQHNPGQIRRRLMRLKLHLPLATVAAAAAADMLHYIVKDCAGIIETQEPTLDVQQQQQQQQEAQGAPAAAAAATATAAAADWVLVFLAPPGVYRELEEKTQAAGGSLTVVAWNCLHDTQPQQQQQQELQQQQQELQQQQQELQQQQQELQQQQEEDRGEESDASGMSAMGAENLGCTDSSPPRSTEASSSRSSSSKSGEEICCCCNEECDEDYWRDTTTRAQRKSRGSRLKKQQKQQQQAPLLSAEAQARISRSYVGVPCALHAATCKHPNLHRRTEQPLSPANSPPPQQRKKKQQQQQQQQQQQPFGDRLTQDALDWLNRDVQQQQQQQQQEQQETPAAVSVPVPPEQQQQQRGVRCRICEETLKDVAELRVHSKGSRHAANVRRQADKLPPLSDTEWKEMQMDKYLFGEAPSQVRGF